jgi:nitrogen regulatory protein PII-like uncharacterized protein
VKLLNIRYWILGIRYWGIPERQLHGASIEEQVEQLLKAVAVLVLQRVVLGETTVEATIEPLRQKLEELNARATVLKEEEPVPPTCIIEDGFAAVLVDSFNKN